jgi:D-sedoheptulose 7-phosphate isomerase
MAGGVAGKGKSMSPSLLAREFKIHQTVLEQTVEQTADVIEQITATIILCFRQGNKLLICGNGGSAADAQPPCRPSP